ncbi:MAG TPA: alpha/beta hydrolase [Propionibacteriaceae bacterium]
MGTPILASENPILAQMGRFSAAYGKNLSVDSLRWRYYRLGDGPAVVWLTGGLRRAAFGFGFLQLLGRRYTVLAPDYPVLGSFEQFDQGLSAILDTERIRRFHLAGQSYGGVLAQPFLACHPQTVDRLVLSSTGPADYGRAWLPVEYLAIGLARLLPERRVKRLLARQLGKVLNTDAKDREDWQAAVRETLEHDLTRGDVVSHFAVAADIIKTHLIHPGAFHAWNGRAVVLRAQRFHANKAGPAAVRAAVRAACESHKYGAGRPRRRPVSPATVCALATAGPGLIAMVDLESR